MKSTVVRMAYAIPICSSLAEIVCAVFGQTYQITCPAQPSWQDEGTRFRQHLPTPEAVDSWWDGVCDSECDNRG